MQYSSGPEVNANSRPNAVAESARNMQHCAYHCRNAVFVADGAGVLKHVNPTFERLTGYTSIQALGKDLSTLVAGGAASEQYQHIWQAICEGGVFSGEVRLVRRDRTFLETEVSVVPIRNPGGELSNLVCVARDLGERRALEAQLLEARKLDAVGTLAGGVAHDFNNMLMVINSYAELALDSVTPDHSLWRNLQEIRTAARRASELTRQLLACGRKQTQQLTLLSLNSVVRDACHMLPRVIGEDVELQLSLDDELGPVRADAGQMQQALLNLAINARDAMPRGGKLTIETRSVRPGRVLLRIRDNGEGISPEDLPRIFEPFYTTKDDGRGNGLGLAMVWSIVQQSGGEIAVESEPGQGTSFNIFLPEAASKEQEPVVHRSSADPAVAPGFETVLVVEDEPVVREATVEFLTRAGYNIIDASNGEEALAKTKEYAGKIDLAITDVVMPQMNGPQLAETLMATHPGIRFLFVSAHGEEAVLRKGVTNLDREFLSKPYSLLTLSQKIRELLETRAFAASAE